MHERIALTDPRATLPALLDRLEARCREAGLAEEAALDVRLVAEEVLTNVAKYAFAPGVLPCAEISFSLTAQGAALEFRDEGRPFDPLAEPGADLAAPLEPREVGRLGLALVRVLVDEARYERQGSTNVLRVVMRLARL